MLCCLAGSQLHGHITCSSLQPCRCNGGVNTALRFDEEGALRFAALQSKAGKSLLQRSGRKPDDISSIVLVEPDESHIKSEAILRIAKYLQNPFPFLALFGFPLPLFVRDSLYDTVSLLSHQNYCDHNWFWGIGNMSCWFTKPHWDLVPHAYLEEVYECIPEDDIVSCKFHLMQEHCDAKSFPIVLSRSIMIIDAPFVFLADCKFQIQHFWTINSLQNERWRSEGQILGMRLRHAFLQGRLLYMRHKWPTWMWI